MTTAFWLLSHGWASCHASAAAAPLPPAPLAYDMSAYELAPQFRPRGQLGDTAQLEQTIRDRVHFEKQRRQIDVYYYRIGYTMSFPLALARRPAPGELPVPIANLKYPWLVWWSWSMEERCRWLHFAWRQFGDEEAGRLLQKELAALAGWDHFYEVESGVGLVTGHLAASLSLALSDTSRWDADTLRQARRAAEDMIERDVWPWFESHWRQKPLGPGHLVNIPVIALVRSAQLARVIGSPRAPALEQRAEEVRQAWCRFRLGPEHHTEGTCYDGYLMDSLTEWLEGLPKPSETLRWSREAFRSLADYWIGMALPGRPDLHVPLDDVEPEMTFWANALVRMAGWYEWPDADWFLRRLPLQRMRAAGLVAARRRIASGASPAEAPAAGPREHPNAVSLGTGWEAGDLLAVIGVSRGKMGHLQAAGGQLIVAWAGRCWITDPGYQQYRPGEERDYTLGIQAHNAPVIGGAAQTARATRLQLLELKPQWQHARLDLSNCYKGLSGETLVQRDVWLMPEGGLVVARDSFRALPNDLEVRTSWLGAAHLAWAFRQGWARLSDGERALWFGTLPGVLQASQLGRHPGSRGPLTLSLLSTLPQGQANHWWVFWCDRACGWVPPSIEPAKDGLRVRLPEGKQAVWTIE